METLGGVAIGRFYVLLDPLGILGVSYFHGE
jgi:hypothetical protein